MSQQNHIAELFVTLEGKMPFERFMDEALYHPRYGYYSSNIATVGRRGDFSTSATIHEVVASAVAKWAIKEKKASLGLGVGKRWHVIEIGAGDGSFARDFIKNTGMMHRPTLSYHIVEKSAPLAKKQKERLPKLQVKWHGDMSDALEACEGEALIFSNELVDAFPACVLRWNSSSRHWEELYLVDQGNDGMSESFRALREPYTQFPSTVLGDWDAEITPLADGQRCEVHWSFLNWLKSWAPQWHRGAMLTIDYGDLFPKLYQKRPQGTVRGYFQGVRVQATEIYDRFGHQDLTADVNFSDLQLWGAETQIETVEFLNQREFLLNMIPSLGDHSAQQQDPALEFLMSPYGAGDAFKVLSQRKAG